MWLRLMPLSDGMSSASFIRPHTQAAEPYPLPITLEGPDGTTGISITKKITTMGIKFLHVNKSLDIAILSRICLCSAIYTGRYLLKYSCV